MLKHFQFQQDGHILGHGIPHSSQLIVGEMFTYSLGCYSFALFLNPSGLPQLSPDPVLGFRKWLYLVFLSNTGLVKRDSMGFFTTVHHM